MSRKYKNPPLIEALCEFRFREDTPWDITIPGLIYDRVRGTFKERVQVNQIDVEVTASLTGIQQAIHPKDRIRFIREDGSALLQVAPQLLSINHLNPYPSWEVFRPMILDALHVYADVALAGTIDQIALRYINRIEFASSKIDLEDFLNFYPYIGPNLPQTYFSFITGTQFIYPDPPSVLKIQLTNADDTRQGLITVMLDLEYRLVGPSALDFQVIENVLEVAHERLESAFEASIQESLRATFEEER